MRWFRSRRLGVTLVALFALACQFAHTFGHVHLERFAGGAPTAWGKVTADSKATAEQPLPQDRHGPIRLVDSFCAICASLSLAGTALVPASPAVVVGEASGGALDWRDLPAFASSTGQFHFEARGPPSA